MGCAYGTVLWNAGHCFFLLMQCTTVVFEVDRAFALDKEGRHH